MNKDAYYFSHDSNARNDQRLIKIRMKYGMEGYGVYFGIIEILREQSDYYLYKNEFTTIAYDLRVDEAMVEDIVLNYGLFEIDGAEYPPETFHSISLSKRMEKMDIIRKKRSLAGQISAKTRASDRHMINKNLTSVKQTGNNEKKEKEIKVKETILNVSFDGFWDLYNYKVGDKNKLLKRWVSLTDNDRELAMAHIPLYIKSTPDKQYRKHPMTYLNNSGWLDEILNNENNIDKYKLDTTGFPMAYCEKCGDSDSYRKEELNGDSRCCQGKLSPYRIKVNV